VVEAARAAGIYVRGAMSCTVGCPYEGEVAPERVAYLAGLMKGIGVQHVGVADTIGVGTPQVRKAIEATLQHFDIDDVSGHFHDTYGQALSNTLAALAWACGTSTPRWPVWAAAPTPRGHRQRGHRRRGLHAARHGHRHRHRSGPADRCRAFISEHLGRPTQSRVAKAVLAKRASSAVCEAV
jgi:hydroxymethylglutaryl-CoA lyase